MPLYAYGVKPHISFTGGRWIIAFESVRPGWDRAAQDWCNQRNGAGA